MITVQKAMANILHPVGAAVYADLRHFYFGDEEPVKYHIRYLKRITHFTNGSKNHVLHEHLNRALIVMELAFESTF